MKKILLALFFFITKVLYSQQGGIGPGPGALPPGGIGGTVPGSGPPPPSGGIGGTVPGSGPPPPSGGVGGTTPGVRVTDIDMYIPLLFIIAVLFVLFYMYTRKRFAK